MLKRLIDFIGAIILLVILFPLCLLVGILIRINSSGPVLFRQRRIGENCAEFYIYKFRSMYFSTPANVPTHLLATPDSYITSIGRFLRKTSLDELPQLINILKGDMSFVGPRPALYNQNDLIELREKYKLNMIKPGLTGWAQVNGRDSLSIAVKVEYDRYYVEHWSLLLDFKILIMTFFNVVRSKDVLEGGKNKKE